MFCRLYPKLYEKCLVWYNALVPTTTSHSAIPSVSLALYPNNVGELVSWWVHPSVTAEGMIMSSATVQMTLSCMGELVLLQLQNTGFVAQATFTCVLVSHSAKSQPRALLGQDQLFSIWEISFNIKA